LKLIQYEINGYGPVLSPGGSPNSREVSES